MKPELAHPTVAGVMAIHDEVLAAHGGSPGLRDEALLESALAAPEATMAGVPLLTSPVEKAAAYLFYLCRNHPFVDGNKRTALATCLAFLLQNGLLPKEDLDIESGEQLVLAVAEGRIDRDETTVRLRRLIQVREG